MKRLIWEFLNLKFKGVVIYHQVFDLNNRRNEKFIIADTYETIMDYTYFYSGKDVRTHVTPSLKKDIQNYFCMNPLDFEGYILEWCRDKSVKKIEM
jgi:hypothetical protein